MVKIGTKHFYVIPRYLYQIRYGIHQKYLWRWKIEFHRLQQTVYLMKWLPPFFQTRGKSKNVPSPLPERGTITLPSWGKEGTERGGIWKEWNLASSWENGGCMHGCILLLERVDKINAGAGIEPSQLLLTQAWLKQLDL